MLLEEIEKKYNEWKENTNSMKDCNIWLDIDRKKIFIKNINCNNKVELSYGDSILLLESLNKLFNIFDEDLQIDRNSKRI